MPEAAKFRAGASHAVLTLLLLGVAIWPRVLGYDSVPLWLDEAWRANLILGDGWFTRLFDGSTSSSVTSIAYAVLTHGLGALHDAEWMLRLSSLLPGVLAVLLFVPVVALATGSATLGYLAALVAASQPTFVAYSKELKPYSFELCVHLLLILLALTYIGRLSRGDRISAHWTTAVVLAGPVAAVSAPNLVFLLPGWYLSILYSSYRSLQRMHWPLILSAVAAAALLWLQYKYAWSHAAKDAALIEFWKGGFFEGGSRVQWLLSRLGNTLRAALESSRGMPLGINGALGALAAAAIIGSLSLQRPEIFLLVASPIFAVIAASSVHLWPLGPFRINVFLYGYFILLVFIGCGFVLRLADARVSRNAANLCYAGIAVLFLSYWIAGFPKLIRNSATLHPANQDVPSALMQLAQELGPACDRRSLVLVNAAGSHAVAYYTTHNDKFSKLLSGQLNKCAELMPVVEAYLAPQRYEELLRSQFSQRDSAWFLYSHLSDADVAVQKEIASKFGKIENEHIFPGAGIFKVSPAPK
jgi:hypothetical protein